MRDLDDGRELYRYKYLSFGQDKKSVDVITEGTIKFTCPLYFNDPFDCQPIMSVTHNISGTPKFNRVFKRDTQGMSPANKMIHRASIVNRMKGEVESGRFFEKFLGSIGVLSLSRRCDSTLMWSHYAEYHKGFVVGFKYDESEFSEDNKMTRSTSKIIPRTVNYSSIRPIYSFANNFDMNSLLIKNEDWGYEEEERAFTWGEQPGIYHYDRDNRLHCVIAGAKIDPDDLNLLKKSVQKASSEIGRKINFKQAKLSRKTYGIEFVDINLK